MRRLKYLPFFLLTLLTLIVFEQPISKAEAASALLTVNPMNYGADNTGKRDSTMAFRRAVELVADGGTITVPEGTFLIDVSIGINLKSNINIVMSKGTILKALPTDLDGYGMLKAFNAKNIKITGGTLVGDRYTHLGASGEWGFGICLKGCRYITINNVTAKEFWGDGFYIDHLNKSIPSQNITLNNCTSTNNRRQGLSVCQGFNITINNCIFSSNKGTAPQAGIDIEPYQDRIVDKVTISNSTFQNNSGCGILAYTVRYGAVRNVTIKSCNIYNNKENGIRLYHCFRTNITNNNVQINTQNGISVESDRLSVIKSNTLSANKGIGISISRSSINKIFENIIKSNGKSAITLAFSVKNHILSNKFYSNNQITPKSKNDILIDRYSRRIVLK